MKETPYRLLVIYRLLMVYRLLVAYRPRLVLVGAAL